MSNKGSFKKNYNIWKRTSDLYIEWVANSELRFFFSKKINFENLSLWWVTDICKKDNLLENQWFLDLKKNIFENKQKKADKQIYFNLIFLIKFFKNFIKDLFWYFIIKFLSFTRYKNLKKRTNCFHSIHYNFFEKKKYVFDRCYGNVHTKYNNKNFFLVTVIKRKEFISELFKKKNVEKNIPLIIADEFITLKDVIYVHFKTLFLFFKLKKYLKRKKKLFYLKNKNCENILKPLLLSSFCGNIQEQILIGLSLNKALKNKKTNFFFTYGEFNPGLRSIYTFIRNIPFPPKIVSIQHGHSNENILYFRHKKKEFTKNSSNEGGYYSPAPDVYFTQGIQYAKILRKYFPRKIKIIGCLKYDLLKFKKEINSKELSDIKKSKKKVILICPSIGDGKYILDFLKSGKNNKYRYILSPHPTFKKNIINEYLSELKQKYDIKIYKNLTTRDLLNISDFVICGFSTVAYEALFLGVKPIRVTDPNAPQFFDINDKVTYAENHQKLNFKLNNYKISDKIQGNYIKKNYFYRLDNNSKSRFWKSINI